MSLRRLALLVVALSLAGAAPADAAPPPGLGPNVVVFDPSMPVSQIQATLDAGAPDNVTVLIAEVQE